MYHHLIIKLSSNISRCTTRTTAFNLSAASFSGTSKPKTTKAATLALLKQNWLDSMSTDSDPNPDPDSEWVFGIDPGTHGALAVIRPGRPVQVFDSPHLEVLVGKTVRRRLDAKSIVELLQSFNAPIGTSVYIEQPSRFYASKQECWSVGFGYGMWIGILVASGFSVVPVSSTSWKNEFQLSGSRPIKDASRELASALFPSISLLLKSEKDDGRVEALLIAAYGKGLKLMSSASSTEENKSFKLTSTISHSTTRSAFNLFESFYSTTSNTGSVLMTPEQPILAPKSIKSSSKPTASTKVETSKAATLALLKQNWLNSISTYSDLPINPDDDWVLGIDPDNHGALAVIRPDRSAEVFDSPHLKALVGKTVRRRLNAKSIFELLQSFNAPIGTSVYLEQSFPLPQNSKQSCWSLGFGYGMWIGTLVASGFSVVPVASHIWKREFQLSGIRPLKDASRELASALFPSMSSLLTRKKDHGRAEALLIAAYGKGLELMSAESKLL